MSKKLIFVTFGCWNKNDCSITSSAEDAKNGVSNVFTSLYNDDENPQFYIVSGDNYYPIKDNGSGNDKKDKKDKESGKDKKDKKEEKDKKDKEIKKIYTEKDFESGFNCLKECCKKHDVPVYLLMGNHDLQKEVDLYEKKSDDNYKRLDKCTIIDKQISYINKIDANREFFKLNTYIKPFDNDSLAIFFNSYLYTDNDSDYLECFKKYRYSDLELNFTTIDDLIMFEEWLIHLLIDNYIETNKTVKNIIIVGHDPILSRRKKKNKDVKLSLNNKGLTFLNKIYNKFSTCHKYYLCADVHQYQKALITLYEHEIYQFVVGTGGTDCDEACVDDINVEHEIKIRENFKYTFKLLKCERALGYLKCYKNNDELNFVFINTHECFNPLPDAEAPSLQAPSLQAPSLQGPSLQGPSSEASLNVAHGKMLRVEKKTQKSKKLKKTKKSKKTKFKKKQKFKPLKI